MDTVAGAKGRAGAAAGAVGHRAPANVKSDSKASSGQLPDQSLYLGLMKKVLPLAAAPNPLFSAANPAPYNMPFVQVFPYRRSSSQYVNPSSFQIVSAGRDQTFGQGDIAWAGASGGAATQQAYDDMANFHPSVLGVPNQ